MKNSLLGILFFLFFAMVQAQSDERVRLRGKVLYRGSNVVNENVINATSQNATITNGRGQFSIRVKEGDELVFTAVNYQSEIVEITKEILKSRRLVIEVNEKITQLDEVVVGPENQEKFLELKNEEFKKTDYDIDETTKVENIALDDKTLRNGINFINIFKALTKSKEKGGEEKREPLKMSKVLREVYDDDFFVSDLKLPQDKIDNFLYYCDAKMPAEDLLKRDNEFQLIEFLVNQSSAYRKELNEEK